VLYLLSDLACFVLFDIAGYRKKVVMDNLRHAFPEKSEQEIKHIARKFYHSFCDNWLEMLKLLTISKEDLMSRMMGNWEIFKQLDDEGLNTYALLGHTFNWEWGSVITQYHAPQQFAGVYMPLANKGMDRLIERIRTRSGAWLISMKAKKGFQRLNGVRYIVGLIADQNPSNMNGALWLPFMHREAPFFKGPEQLARRAKAAVIFAGIKKVRRGHYAIHFEILTRDASHMQDGEIMKAYVLFMEQQLRTQPENWLWTHKRWKHTRA